MIYAVGKGYGDLIMAKSLTLDELYEAYSALIIFDGKKEK